jgi:hypothetical protein
MFLLGTPAGEGARNVTAASFALAAEPLLNVCNRGFDSSEF